LFLDVIFEWGRKGPETFVGKKLQWPLLYIPVLYYHAFDGLHEISPASPSGLYNAHYMCLVSKLHDSSPNPIRMTHAQIMEMPMTHGFAPEQHQVRFDCPIFKEPGNFKTETLRLVHGVEATDNKTLRICVAWHIKRLVHEHHDIF
jgi:hypothetical protein